MPSVKNKLILNTGRVGGRNADIHSAHETMGKYADEMESHNLLGTPEVLAFRDQMEKLCAAYDRAQDKYNKGCWQLADDMRRFIDSQLFPPAQP
jgi:hypothetical protein